MTNVASFPTAFVAVSVTGLSSTNMHSCSNWPWFCQFHKLFCCFHKMHLNVYFYIFIGTYITQWLWYLCAPAHQYMAVCIRGTLARDVMHCRNGHWPWRYGRASAAAVWLLYMQSVYAINEWKTCWFSDSAAAIEWYVVSGMHSFCHCCDLYLCIFTFL